MSKSLADNPFITEMKDKNGDSWYHQIVLELKDKEIERLEEDNKKLKECLGIVSPSRELQEGKYWENNEIERLNNIINELEKWLEERSEYTNFGLVLDKIKELKGSDKE